MRGLLCLDVGESPSSSCKYKSFADSLKLAPTGCCSLTRNEYLNTGSRSYRMEGRIYSEQDHRGRFTLRGRNVICWYKVDSRGYDLIRWSWKVYEQRFEGNTLPSCPPESPFHHLCGLLFRVNIWTVGYTQVNLAGSGPLQVALVRLFSPKRLLSVFTSRKSTMNLRNTCQRFRTTVNGAVCPYLLPHVCTCPSSYMIRCCGNDWDLLDRWVDPLRSSCPTIRNNFQPGSGRRRSTGVQRSSEAEATERR